MASWKDISSTVKTYKDTYESLPSQNKVAVCLQYDSDSKTATSITVRFKYYRPDGKTGNLHDSMYILYNANDSDSTVGNLGRTLFRLKSYTGDVSSISWPFYSKSFTINKGYTTDHFTLQDYWICNDGQNATVSSTLSSYTASHAKTFYDTYYSGAFRAALCCKVESSTFSNISGTVATAVTAGSVSITDNYNNSYNVVGTCGTAGTNNPVTSASLSYTNETGNTAIVDCKGKTVTKTIAFTPADKNATKNVTASIDTDGTYNNPAKVSKTVAIRQYVGPNQPTNLKVSYNKNRFTLKENWTLSWTAPAINNGCPIKGYRIRLYRKRGSGSWIKLPIYNSSGGMGHVTGVTNVSPTDYYWDRDGTSTSATIYTKYYNKEVIANYEDILPGDIVKFAVTAYTRYGDKYDGNKLFKTSESFSSEHIVQNAGVIRVKVGSAWKEGQVYVKTAGSWKEADVVSVKTASGWQESE